MPLYRLLIGSDRNVDKTFDNTPLEKASCLNAPRITCWPLPLLTDCSVCSDGYSAQLSFVCSKCPENNAAGIVVAVALAIGALFVAVAVVSYVMSGEAGLGAGQGLVERLARYIPLQSVKIVIVAWQILTQVSTVYACLILRTG